jgi:hypothetical protein
MGEFLKCECSHCGQPIEYPSEGTGQTVLCPTCEKPVTLTPVNSPAPNAYVTRVRAEPATEKQKEKLRYFGYTFDENISKGQASDALDKCVGDFPEVNQAYYNRPATEEQLAKLPPHFKAERAKPLSYGSAKDLILEREVEGQNKREEKLDRELLIGYIANYEEFYPSLTLRRIKNAAKALDESSPGWHEKKGCEKVLLEKVAELNPELAAKEDWLERLTYL